MARRLFIAGNWKMNKNAQETTALAGELRAFPRPGVQGLELGDGHLSGRAGTVGRPVHRRVVHDDDRPVGARVDVQLDPLRVVLQAARERGQRVLRRQTRSAAMGHQFHGAPP